MGNLRIVLLSGAFKVGKSAVATELIEAFGFRKVSSSDYLRTLTPDIAQLDSGQARLVLQEKGDQLDIETDYSWLIDPVTTSAIAEAPGVSNWLIDAVRKQRQVEHFRGRFGAAVAHFHLLAPEIVLKARCGLTPDAYTRAVNHPNEVNSRALGDVADQSLDTSLHTPQQIAAQIAKGDR